MQHFDSEWWFVASDLFQSIVLNVSRIIPPPYFLRPRLLLFHQTRFAPFPLLLLQSCTITTKADSFEQKKKKLFPVIEERWGTMHARKQFKKFRLYSANDFQLVFKQTLIIFWLDKDRHRQKRYECFRWKLNWRFVWMGMTDVCSLADDEKKASFGMRLAPSQKWHQLKLHP